MAAAGDSTELEVEDDVEQCSNLDDDTDINATEFPLKDLPNEVLILVMSHLNDTSLLDMTLVSKRFRALAKKAFAMKYNGETEAAFYYLPIFCKSETEEHRLYHPYFQTFGENMSAIVIHSSFLNMDVSRDHWLYQTIRNYCTALTKVYISGGREMNLSGILTERTSQVLTSLHLIYVGLMDEYWADRVYPKLVSFHCSCFDSRFDTFDSRFDDNAFNTLLVNNPQITDLTLSYINFKFDILGQLKGLKSLHIMFCDVTFGPDKFQMDSLEKCELVHDSPWLTLIEIGAACKHLKRLSIHEYDTGNDEWIEGSIETICSFKELRSLEISICPDKLTLDQLTSITGSLPNLKSLHFAKFGWKYEYDIRDISPLCKNLENLIISDFDSHGHDWDIGIYSDLATITKNNRSMKLSLNLHLLRAVFTQGRVQILYIDDYYLNPWDLVRKVESIADQPEPDFDLLGLDDKCLKKIVGFVGAKSQIALLNTCQRTRKIVKDYLSKHLFYFTEDVDVNDLKNAAEYIHHMDVIAWEIFGTELDFVWPKIRTLKLSKCTMARLFSLKCPMVAHLEVQDLETIDQPILDGMNVSVVDFNGAYRNLTTLKFGCYNDGVELFLSKLDGSVCVQMQKLSLASVNHQQWESVDEFGFQRRKYVKLVNILMRFRNLTALHLLFPDVQHWHLQSFFEKCSKLINLAICFNGGHSTMIFRLIKENCCQMRNIRLVGQRDTRSYPEVMQGIQRLLPGVSIEIIYVDGDVVLAASPIDLSIKRPTLSSALKL